ncbi:MAG: type II toxin-antitoxin system VapC family toxin [Cyanobacteriota bacterium]|nr:type II toxin-antitoxin system VapC family toxin [Cyanobacteriota bacterium]
MMQVLVVDSSALCALCFDDETTPESELLLQALEGGGVWAPGLLLWEVANVLLMAQRKGRLSHAERVEALQLIESLDIQLDAAAPAVVWHDVILLADQTGLTSYDAAYLELAMRLGTPLASRDKELQRCCDQLGVQLQAC